ncbi:uncharacterized protein LOC125670309 [Ostrea edulis]|uniref:uncharacterized protein LOC125670309 n=1 Tax=Ostrea edulis TaxID=37623 RepID=UPI00209621CB|nr:uncharacterized protein LOC125670309 [Ostrea edulis]
MDTLYLQVLLLCFVTISSSYATQCYTDAECMQDECCFRHEGPMIVSKRQLLTSLNTHHGVCEKYQVLGDHCSPFDKLNGHCSCGHGLTCQFVPASTTMSLKRKLYMPGPGAYQCAPSV